MRRLRQNRPLLQDYDYIIQKQIEKGIVEDIQVTEEAPTHLHYFPHHAIIRRDKATTKIRVVYDASAKTDGNPSLNDCVFIGSKFNQDLLVSFGSYPFALMADIEKAFLILMISIAKQDRDAL